MMQNAEYKELLHVLCHDLNNSLGILKMAVDFAEVTGDINSLDEYKQPISLAVNNGLDIIALVREMCRLEEYKFKLTPINLLEIFNEAEILLKKQLDDKELIIETDVTEDLYVSAEKRSLLNSVIINLLTNAIKFSEKGNIIKVKATIPGEGKVDFSVKDFGIGIPDNIMKHIFDISKSKSRRGTMGKTGTGFGLPMVKKFVNLYGGTVEVFSQDGDHAPENRGTEVKITLNAG